VKITARDKRVLIAGAAICVAGLIVYLAVSVIPNGDDLGRMEQLKKAMLLKQRETLAQEEVYRLRVDQYRQRLKDDFTRVLPGDNANVAAAQLQQVLKDLADRTGVEITRKDIQKEQKIQDGLTKVSVRIETNCLPDQLVQFLAAIENYEKFLTLDLLAINSFKMQKRYEIRPSLTVSGYIMTPETEQVKTAGGI
jgi:hypothetical protein